VGAEIFTNFVFLSIISATDMLESHSSQKMSQWVRVQGQVNVAKNTPTCGVPPENPKPKVKKFFFWFRLEDLLNPYRVWTAL